MVEKSRPAWARELKPGEVRARLGAEVSRPAWARELKHIGGVARLQRFVAPRVGA